MRYHRRGTLLAAAWLSILLPMGTAVPALAQEAIDPEVPGELPDPPAGEDPTPTEVPAQPQAPVQREAPTQPQTPATLPTSQPSMAPAAPAGPAQSAAPLPEVADAESDQLTNLSARAPMEMMETGENWPAYGGTYNGTRYSPLNQINRENVETLERVWTYRTGDMPPDDAEDVPYSPETTPIKIGDNLYLCSPKNILIAINAMTGLEEWRYDPVVPDDAIPHAAACRGVAYFENPEAGPDELCATRIVEGTLDARLIAVDARSGQICPDFGRNGQVLLEEGMGSTVPGWVSVTSPPTIVRGVVVIGHQVQDGQAEDAPSGVVRGYDAISGELVWAWDLGQPDLKGGPPEGETYTRGTPNMWTTAAGDEELGHVYLPLGNSSVDYYGANRSELENEYATSVVAIDVTTGQEVWHFQTVHYDIWDYDLGSQPALVDFPAEGGTVPALIISSKQGDIFILDRRTGESLFPVEERPVPQDMGVEPDNLAPTQPFSTYHTLAFEPLEEKDMWGMTPLDQLWCRIQYRMSAYEGIYTPPTVDRHWIQYPGYNGGQDWGSLAVDEERGIIIANYNDIPNHNRLLTREEAEERNLGPISEPGGLAEDPQAGAPYAIDVNPGWRQWTGLMCKQPPYGGIRAIDLATGETIWDQPLGKARRNGPFGIPSMLPIRIGTPNNGGPLITAGGLVFIAAATDELIRAIDIETGDVVWEDVLPAGGQATPMTYKKNGRQFIVIMAGGHNFMETPAGDYVLAWSLPGDSMPPQE